MPRANAAATSKRPVAAFAGSKQAAQNPKQTNAATHKQELKDSSTNPSVTNLNNNYYYQNNESEYNQSSSLNELDMQPVEVFKVPEDQIKDLSNEQMSEVFTKILTATNPKHTSNQVTYNYNTNEFESNTTNSIQSQMSVHFEMTGILIHQTSEEAQQQLEYEKVHNITTPREWAKMGLTQQQQTSGVVQDKGIIPEPVGLTVKVDAKQAGTSTQDDEEEEDEQNDVYVPTSDRALKNQFNYSERASQTFNPPLRNREISTEPPPCIDFTDNVSRWEIFDFYVSNLEKEIKERNLKEKLSSQQTIGKSQNKQDDLYADVFAITANKEEQSDKIRKEPHSFNHYPTLSLSLKVMERLVNQIAETEFYYDFKYYEDAREIVPVKKDHQMEVTKDKQAQLTQLLGASPSAQDQNTVKGSFLQLWKFAPLSSKSDIRRSVTCICWNHEYSDLFAVSYGSYDFAQPQSNQKGLICIFTLKNTNYPEYSFHTKSGVMTLDFYPITNATDENASLLVAGLYDGSVLVYDIRHVNKLIKIQQLASKNDNRVAIDPIYQSVDPTTKHTDPVFQVCWNVVELPKPVEAGKADKEQDKESTVQNLNFYSISNDGKMMNWTCNKNDLIAEEVISVQLNQQNNDLISENLLNQQQEIKEIQSHQLPDMSKLKVAEESKTNDEPFSPSDEPLIQDTNSLFNRAPSTQKKDDDSIYSGLASATCFALNRHCPQFFVVGTEEGLLHLYNKAHSNATRFVRKYQGHSLCIYSVIFNPFHPGVFMTCSADWQICIWELNTSYPILNYDLNSPVNDIAWSPYSSTVFAAVTSDGKLRVYDLNSDKHFPASEIKIANKKNLQTKLTHVKFNPKQPIVCVGDDRGVVSSYKLSSNLRKSSSNSISDIDVEEEIMKLENLLIIENRESFPPAYLKPFLTTLGGSNDKDKKKKNGDKKLKLGTATKSSRGDAVVSRQGQRQAPKSPTNKAKTVDRDD